MEATAWICCACAKREKGQTHLTQPSEHKKCLVYECAHERCDACTEKLLGYIVKEEVKGRVEMEREGGDMLTAVRSSL